MRHDPTIGFVRDLYAAPMLATEWTVVSEHQEFKDAEPFILEQISKNRRNIVRDVIRGLLDFGWQAFETVWAYDDESKKIEIAKNKETGMTEIIPKRSRTGLDGWIPVCEKALPFELTTS